MKLVVRQPGSWKMITVEVTHIRAYYMRGKGDATIQYEAKAVDGKWYPFRKKENPGMKLPSFSKERSNWTRKLVDVSGVRGIYKYVSDEVEVNKPA